MDRKCYFRVGFKSPSVALATLATFAAVIAIALLLPARARAQEGDPYTLQTMAELNGGLKALWMDIRAEQIEYLTAGRQRSGARMHRQPYRWVANDARRAAGGGGGLTYLVDLDGLAGSGLDAGAAELAIDRAMAGWSTAKSCFAKNVGLAKRADHGDDPDLFDSVLGYGELGSYRIANIVHGGWLPPSFFDAVGGPGSGETVLAFAVTFVFADTEGEPTDVDGDGYMDVAVSEIYYNSGFSWLADGFDLESVALHEAGHALGIGHAPEPSDSVMEPVYGGVRRSPRPRDGAALCSIWASWPK